MLAVNIEGSLLLADQLRVAGHAGGDLGVGAAPPVRSRTVTSSCGVQGEPGLRAVVVVPSKGPRRVLTGPYLGQV